MSRPVVEVGQIWEARESRMAGRQVRVVRRTLGFAFTQHAATKRISRIRIEELQRRYRLITPSSSDLNA